MSRYYDPKTQDVYAGLIARDIGLTAMLLLALGMGGCPHYTVWQQGLAGKAALERATQDRQIRIQEAQAKMESAKMLAEAEIIKAGGVAKANSIIGDSLKGNEAYLRFLWISNMESTQNQVIYVPTEAGLPILEAGKRAIPATEAK